MKIQIVDTDSEFDDLEVPWNHLSEMTSPNFFSSFDYVRTAWKYFRGARDRLYILVLSEGPSIIGIAPFYIARCRRWRIPHRAIEWIATWEGDRPRLIAREDEARCWNEIFRFLESQKHSWEVLDLVEQPLNGPEDRGWSFLPRSGWYWEKSPDSIDYYISLEGSWEDYLKGLDSGTRHEWTRRKKRFSSNNGGIVIERVSDPERMREALSRFVAIEREGWKAKAGIGVGKDERTLSFYQELLVRLAGKGQVFIYFLKSGGETIAGKICFIQRSVVYSLHTTYLPVYKAYSPGILVQADLIQKLFGGPYRELDMLAMRENGASPKHKTDWATGRRETVRFTAYRVPSRLLPYVMVKRLEDILNRGWRKIQELRKMERHTGMVSPHAGQA
jgi:CelD/BcsL family acetyltransferase involved in cellulose biosynthesis